MTQVFLNIMKNAHEEFLSRKIDKGRLRIHAHKTDDMILIDFEDNAGGINEEIMPQIFDPYFSTKVKRHGIGLGLYSCKVIVEEQLKGDLSCENRNKGACFTISIPLK
jgi:signal transduction histidine kinase